MGRPGANRRTDAPVLRPAVSLARALSKLGFMSRSRAVKFVASGRVRVNGAPVLDPGFRVDPARDFVEVDGIRPAAGPRTYLMLNKPRGLVTTAADEKGRPTVFSCLDDPSLPRVVPVGRLDMASEGLLLFTNDTGWADRLLDPANRVARVYHVQVEPPPGPGLCRELADGVADAAGERLTARSARVLRAGVRTGWLEVVLEEGKNREVRRLLAACGRRVRRLVRVSFGPLRLGDLPKGRWRLLSAEEREAVERALQARAGRRRRP
jgi:23S rRNA pseudouridine2605 synthase